MSKAVHAGWIGIALSLTAVAQPAIFLKNRRVETTAEADHALIKDKQTCNAKKVTHYVVQFTEPPGPEQSQALVERGARVLHYVHENGFLISIDDIARLDELTLRWIGAIEPEDKISQLLPVDGPEPVTVVIEFYSDIAITDARWLVSRMGIETRDHPDLALNQLLALIPPERIGELAARDEIAYIFPASENLAAGRPVVACESAFTGDGRVSQLVAKVGEGWDGPGRNEARLGYVFSQLSSRLPTDIARSEVLRALNEWAKYAKLTFTSGTNSSARSSINIIFGGGNHGDAYPFDGPGGVMAHTFYPAPVTAEPLAGDMHFDDEEAWKVGADIDLFSVALHEAGHALGLSHSDHPGDVMYPYYSRVTGLSQNDINAILDLYAARPTIPVTPASPGVPDPPAPGQPSVGISSPSTSGAYTTASSSIAVRGTASHSSGIVRVVWSNDRGGSGQASGSTNWQIAAVTLSAGVNNLTITAVAGSGATAIASLRVNYQRSTQDVTAPTLAVTSPSGPVTSTSASSIVVRGSASDNAGVTLVSWFTSAGASGNMTGTTSWTSGPIPLIKGFNSITVRAWDAAGNMSWRLISVTRQ